MTTLNKIWIIANDLWEEPTTIEAIVTHLCYLVTSSFAFFFFTELGGVIERDYAVVSEASIAQCQLLLSWSNLFINLLTILIIFEISSYIAKAYWDYRRDNL